MERKVKGELTPALQADIITLIPIFHSKQDIRSFYTIKTNQTYRSQGARFKGKIK